MNQNTISQAIPDKVAQDAENEKISKILADACRTKQATKKENPLTPLVNNLLNSQDK